VLVLKGEFETQALTAFEAAIAARPARRPLIADLTAVTFLDSTGIHALFRAAQSGRIAALVCPRGSSLARVLDIVGAEKILPLFDDVAEAARRLARPDEPTGAAASAGGGRRRLFRTPRHPRALPAGRSRHAS
jgi:anti-anti-sigma factor